MASRMEQTEDIDGASNTNVSSEDISMSVTRNGESATQLSVKSYCYTWTINDFFKCLEFYREEENSISFDFSSAPFTFMNTEWYWCLRVETHRVWSKRRVKEMKIVLKSKSNIIASDFTIKSEVTIVDGDGKVLSCSPKIIVGNGDMKEYFYPSLLLSSEQGGNDFFPKKLIVRSEFSALISEICEDTGSSFSKYGNRDVRESDCLTKNDVFPSPEYCSRCSVLSRIPPFSWLFRIGVEMREFRVPILVVLCVSLVLVLLID